MATAVNRVRGEMEVTIGGTSFVLVPSFERLAKVEAMLDRSLVQFVQELRANQRVTLVELASVIEILTREPKLSTNRIGGLILRDGAVTVLAPLVGLIGRALMGGGDDDEGDETSDGDDEGKGPGDDGPSE